MSLLDEAKEKERVPKSEEVTFDQIEVGIAWAKGEVSTAAVARALNTQTSSALPLLARFLGAAVRDGYLKESRKGTSNRSDKDGSTAA